MMQNVSSIKALYMWMSLCLKYVRSQKCYVQHHLKPHQEKAILISQQAPQCTILIFTGRDYILQFGLTKLGLAKTWTIRNQIDTSHLKKDVSCSRLVIPMLLQSWEILLVSVLFTNILASDTKFWQIWSILILISANLMNQYWYWYPMWPRWSHSMDGTETSHSIWPVMSRTETGSQSHLMSRKS